MPNKLSRHFGALAILVLITASATFIAINLTSIEWPLAASNPLALKPFETSNSSSRGLLVINASYVANGVETPISGAGVSLYLEPENTLLGSNRTDAKGILRYSLSVGNYSLLIGSRYGEAGNTLVVEGNSTTVVNYVSVNDTESSVSFDIVALQPNFVAPWDSVYVEIPKSFGNLNLSATGAFIEPVYRSASLNSSATNYSSVARLPDSQIIINLLSLSTFPLPGNKLLISASVLSEEASSSSPYVWIQLKPVSPFSTKNLSGLVIHEYNSSLTISIYSSAIRMR